MESKIIIEYKENFIHARQYGDDSYDISFKLWHGIVEACEKHNCFNILGETFTKVSLSTMESYDHIKMFEMLGISIKHRIAWVHHDEDTFEMIQMIETLLSNRGFAGKVFKDFDKAKFWLLKRDI